MQLHCNYQSVHLVLVYKKQKYKHTQRPVFYPMMDQTQKDSFLLASKSIYHSLLQISNLLLSQRSCYSLSIIFNGHPEILGIILLFPQLLFHYVLLYVVIHLSFSIQNCEHLKGI